MWTSSPFGDAPPGSASRFRGAALLTVSGAALLVLSARDAFDANPLFHPHGYCYLWDPSLVGIHVASDALIGLAYMTIPIALISIVRRARGGVPFSGMFVAFGIFIIACGMTHFVEILTLWQPFFWSAAGIKVVTAIASVATAMAVPAVVPRVLTMIDASRLAEQRRLQLEEAQQLLEQRVAERTRELSATVARLESEMAARGRAEQELAFSQAQLQAILDHTPSYVYVKDTERRFLLANRRLADSHGGPDRLLGRTNRELFPPALADEYERHDLRALAGETVQEVEHEELGDGPHVYLSEKFPIRDASGRIVALGGISSDVTERQRVAEAREALLARERELREEAERTVREKDEFLAILSHELRTPLNAVLGYAQMLRAGRLAGERAQRALETIERNGHALGRLVEDLLTMSGMVTRRLSMTREPVNLADVVAAAVHALAPTAAESGVQIEVQLPPALPASGDRVRLQQVFGNLLENAVKFTLPGGRVDVRGTVENGWVRVTIADTGIGFAPGLAEQLFTAFQQADSGSTRERGGLGLGLAIVRHIIAAHGGAVDAHSEGNGRGATFTVRLPTGAPASVDSH